MNALKFKTLTYLSLISALLLIGCSQKAEQLPSPVDKPAAVITAAVSTAPVAAPVTQTKSFEKLGLFTGAFNPGEEYIRKQAAFIKWMETAHPDIDDYIYELSEIPVEFRPFVHKGPLYGSYDFISPNRLSIVIEAMREDNTFLAHSIAAGNKRAIKGTWKKVGEDIQLVGSEPGDDVNDGRFDMMLTASGLIGNWTPNGKKAIPKTFKLKFATFIYEPEIDQNQIDLGHANFRKNPSVDLLKSEDVENLLQPHIRLIRNFIFAKHGYSFKGKDLRLTFEAYDWYTPVSVDIKADLTEVEKANITLLNRYEKYADKHYDEYGR